MTLCASANSTCCANFAARRAPLTRVRQAGARPREAHPASAWPVARFVLYASENTPRGVRYLGLGNWPLVPGLQLPRFRPPH